MTGNATLVNFAGGETSPKSNGRFDLPWYTTAAKKLLNFIAEVAGPARFRPGFKVVRQTRRGQVARIIRFQFSNATAYMLEFTPSFMRVYKSGDLLTLDAQTITGITQANPAVMTVAAATGMANGTECILSGIVGMPELNGRQVLLAGASGLTFQLTDAVTGANIDATGFAAYSSGGTAAPVYEIASPYLADEFDLIQYAQHNTTMYLVHPQYAPRKLTVDSADRFTLGTFTRTKDPFNAFGPTLHVTGITRGTNTLITFTAGDVINTKTIYTFSGVVGTTQINTGQYRLVRTTSSAGKPRAFLRTATTKVVVNSTAWTAYTSGGLAASNQENPLSVAFYEGRLFYGGTNQRPECLFGSRAPDNAGNNRFDDFTGGTAADFACFFQLAPVGGSVGYMSWLQGGQDYLFAGTFGGPFRISGSGLDIPITPLSINVRQFDTAGCEEAMAVGCAEVFFLQRGGTTLRSIKLLNQYLSTFESVDMCLNAEQIPYSRLRRVVLQHGRPDTLWVLRDDGVLAGMTVHITSLAADAVAGWHRHKIGGASAKVIDVGVIQRTDLNDQIWIVAERTVNGTTRRTVEIMADDVAFPDAEDFFSDEESEDDDLTLFNNAVYRLQEQYVHMDAAAAANGSDRGVAAAATMTPGATTGTSVAFTASAAVFTSADVGKEIWKKPSATTGVGGGRAVITGYSSTTSVTAKITVAFDSTAAIAAGDWYFAGTAIYGLYHLEGSRVAVVTDGAVYSDGQTDDYPTVTVANGHITLTAAAAVVWVGLPYTGLIKSHNLDLGAKSGPSQAKPRNISTMFIRFLNTLGVEFGTDLYAMESVEHRNSNANMDRPAPVFSGIRKLPYGDSWDAETEKHVVVAQKLPLPAIVQFIDVEYDTTDEG